MGPERLPRHGVSSLQGRHRVLWKGVVLLAHVTTATLLTVLMSLACVAVEATHFDDPAVMAVQGTAGVMAGIKQQDQDPQSPAAVDFPPDTPRLPRSPLYPPTVTSLHPYRKGISNIMHDSSLSVGIQSEGPSHPNLMRMSPPRKQDASLPNDHKMVGRPHIQHRSPEERHAETLDFGTDGFPQLQYYSGYPLEYSSESHYDSVPDGYDSTQLGVPTASRITSLVTTDEEEKRSRQRRVEDNQQDRRTDLRHGRFEEFLGSRGRTSQGSRRHDTFGLDISERLWTGLRRSATPAHPAAARSSPHPDRQVTAVEVKDIWDTGTSAGGRFRGVPKFGQWLPSNDRDSHPHHMNPSQNYGDPQVRTRPILFHPGSKMTSRGSTSRNDDIRQRESVIIHGGAGATGSHPRMLGPRGQSTHGANTEVEDPISLDDITAATGLSQEELIRSMETRGLSLEHVLQMLRSGASFDDVAIILKVTEPESILGSTTATPITPTLDPAFWEDWLNQEITNANRNRETGTDTADNDSSYFTDPIYATGVHPNEDPDSESRSVAPTPSGKPIKTSVYQPPDYLYDYYSEEERRDGTRTSGQARITSFTVQKLPEEDDKENNISVNDLTQTFSSDPALSDPHPHYKQRDQYIQGHPFDYKELSPQVSSNVHLKNLQSEAETWSSSSGDVGSRPLTLTVIAASAIMGSLAVFTLFVLVAYTIVKCTKKPTLNNYQVSDKKPVEVTT